MARKVTKEVKKERKKKAPKKNKYGPKAEDKIATVMREFEQGSLRSGGSGKRVTKPKQAKAIALNEARERGFKVPKKKKTNKKK